jgi:hypothetical protein
MPRRSAPFPEEDAPNFNPEDPYADKVALVDHRDYLLGQYFIREAKAKVRTHSVNGKLCLRCTEA